MKIDLNMDPITALFAVFEYHRDLSIDDSSRIYEIATNLNAKTRLTADKDVHYYGMLKSFHEYMNNFKKASAIKNTHLIETIR